jgi:uncharacterized protein YndB with AHSA1/START domain
LHRASVPGAGPRRNRSVASLNGEEVALQEPIRRRVVLDAPIDDVWRAVIEPERLGAWFGAEVELDPRPGGAIAFRLPDGSARRGVVEVVDPPHRLAFRWRTITSGPSGPAVADVSRVELELAPAPHGGTAVNVTESPGVLAPDTELLAPSGRSVA